jgi:hypothetical protein
MYCGYRCQISATKCAVFDNGSAALLSERAVCNFDRCTIVGNGEGIMSAGSPNAVGLRQSILAFNTGIPVGQGSSPCDVGANCCDVFGNSGGDYVGCLAGQNGINGNFSLDPGFCDYSGGDFRPRADSPCAEGNHPDGADCDRIGASAAGCD